MTASISPPAAGSGPISGQLTHQQILVVFSGLMLGMLLAALDQTIVSTALPTIVGELGGLNHLSWVVTAYLLTSTASTPLYGKISDIYGRKIVFQIAIVVFLVASALAGLSQNMGQLIATRALQGLGAGGLMALALAIVGDVVSPRERGRYQGYFGGVFALASVAGPLLGGFFTEHLSWRWVFYINLPIGLIALVVTSAVLNLPFRRLPHRIDYVGAALMVAGVSALLLVTVWGGTEYGWGSPQIISLAVAGVVLIAAFLWWEARAAEPILPLSLFRNSVFSVTSAVGFIVGLAMFGAIIFLPVYLQVVDGVTPTVSGLLLLPLMVGILTSSIASGRAITRLGRYKKFPVAGTAVMAVGMWLLSHLGTDTSRLVSSLYMLVLGLGLGLVMQTLVLAVQNAVDYTVLGVATSAATFFRSMGGAFGTAIFGAILTARLDHYLPQFVPGAAAAGTGGRSLVSSPKAIQALPPQVRDGVIEAFVRSLHTVFLTAIPIVVAAFLLTLFLREIRLRESSGLARQSPAASAPEAGLGLSAEAADRLRRVEPDPRLAGRRAGSSAD